ncbi:hypothetical protein GWK47_028440 [Chionoecetes opilio]|uniref:Uncharacterized protein n=1 Tax=Chionoecetes opilio TaxID=41210 RepID=A0A8J5D5Q6_CHIOP|nr:hypothetical protein GWK47_028440 [Chionoecetes opilio]
MWWNLVSDNGPIIGYTPNATKSVLIVKPEHYDNGVELFNGSGVIVTKDGQRHLGAVIGTEEFKVKYVGEKVSSGFKEVDVLSDMGQDRTTRSLLSVHAWPTTSIELRQAHHPRHQPSPQTAGKLHQEHLPNSAAEIPYHGR